MRRLAPLGFVASLLSVLLAIFGLAAVAGRRAIRPRRLWFRRLPLFSEKPEEVSFTASDSLLLQGWFWHHPEARDGIVLCHGWHMSRVETWQLGLKLWKRGHNVLIFDFRACGQSAGIRTTGGNEEVRDLLGALTYLQSRPDVDPHRVGALGLSMGAAVVLLAATQSQDMAAIVADSSFVTLDSVLERGLPFLRYAPGLLRRSFLLPLAEAVLGLRASRVRPIEAVQALGHMPILFIHALEDRLVPSTDSEALYAAAQGPKELWLVEGADHCMARFLYPEEYLERVDRFFRRHLTLPEKSGVGHGAKGEGVAVPRVTSH